MGDERMFPIQSERGAKAHPREIPWSVAERAYSVYAAKWSSGQTLERLAERGGFAPSEMDEFLPGWREEVSELSRLRAELAALTQRPTEAERDAAESELLASRAVEDRNEAQAREAESRSDLADALARAEALEEERNDLEKRAAELEDRAIAAERDVAAARAEGEALKVAARALLSDPAMTVEVPDEPEVIVHPAAEDEAAVRKCSPVCAVCVASPCAPDCTAGRLRALSGPSATTGGEEP